MRSQDGLVLSDNESMFPSFNHLFSPRDMDSTEVDEIIRQKDPVKVPMTHNVLKQKVINQRIQRLQQAKMQLHAQQRLRESFNSSQYVPSPQKIGNFERNDSFSTAHAMLKKRQDTFMMTNEEIVGNSTKAGNSIMNDGISRKKAQSLKEAQEKGNITLSQRAKMRQEEERQKQQSSMLDKFRDEIEEKVVVPTPKDILIHPKYSRYYFAMMIEMDHDWVQVIDWLLANLFKTFLLLKDRYWQEALLTVY